jgi:hypothetical protein
MLQGLRKGSKVLQQGTRVLSWPIHGLKRIPEPILQQINGRPSLKMPQKLPNSRWQASEK